LPRWRLLQELCEPRDFSGELPSRPCREAGPPRLVPVGRRVPRPDREVHLRGQGGYAPRRVSGREKPLSAPRGLQRGGGNRRALQARKVTRDRPPADVSYLAYSFPNRRSTTTTSPDVFASRPAVAENVLVRAAGVFEGIGQDRHPVEGSLVVDGLGDPGDRAV